MTSQERDKITKRMLWIIPAMIPCIIGDYCMGLEPKDSAPVSFMISTGSSKRGLSEVTMAISLIAPASRPIIGLLPRSLLPPQPKRAISLAGSSLTAAASKFFSPSGV